MSKKKSTCRNFYSVEQIRNALDKNDAFSHFPLSSELNNACTEIKPVGMRMSKTESGNAKNGRLGDELSLCHSTLGSESQDSWHRVH